MHLPIPNTADAEYSQAIKALQNGRMVVMPTDTLYGVLASALLPEAVERVFTLRRRDLNKPVIILIADFSDLGLFSLTPNEDLQKFLTSVWPGAVSVVVPVEDSKLEYLHRGTRSLAFRLPNNDTLRAFLRKSGPLIAPSANIAGQPPATTVAEARHYFGDQVDQYIDGGERIGQPSTLVRFTTHGVEVLRQGSVTFDTKL